MMNDLSKQPMNQSQRGTLTSMQGCPVAHNKNSMTAGPFGPTLLQDHYLLEKIHQFARDQIPPRNVHAIGCGAFGTFTATNPEASKYSCANLFIPGTKTPFVSRFSGVFNEKGEADTARDARGFALKFKTTEGNWDLLCVNTAVFNCRDMKIGPDFIRSLKRDPRTGLKNRDMAFDFANHHPESLHATLMLYTDRCGTPDSFRNQHWFAANTYSLVNQQKERFWVRFHLVALQGQPIGLPLDAAKTIAGEEPNFLQKDLKDAIESKNFPKWKLCVQVMKEAEGYTNPIAFDCTKAWKHEQFPLIELGIIECDDLPVDHFTQVEQVAFSPAHIVPGIGYSPDKLLQGRLLMYDTTQYHRIGPNYKMLPINCPINMSSNYYNGGNMNLQSTDKFPNYTGTVFQGNEPQVDPTKGYPTMKSTGDCGFYDMPNEGSDADYYLQPREFLKVLSDKERDNLCVNLASDLYRCTKEVYLMTLAHFNKINPQFGETVRQLIITKQNGTVTVGEKVAKEWESIEKSMKPNGKSIPHVSTA